MSKEAMYLTLRRALLVYRSPQLLTRKGWQPCDSNRVKILMGPHPRKSEERGCPPSARGDTTSPLRLMLPRVKVAVDPLLRGCILLESADERLGSERIVNLEDNCRLFLLL